MWISGCTILAGGHAHCTRAWTLGRTPLHQCWKLYHVVKGSSTLVFDSGRQTLAPDRIYLINGYRQTGQFCEHSMVVDWLHFQLSSWRFRFRLERLPPVSSMACPPGSWRAKSLEEVRRLFDQPPHAYRELRSLRADAPPATHLRVLGVLLGVLGELLEKCPEPQSEPPELPPQLQRALDYMEHHYLDNPPLARLAEVAGWQKEHFHRRFRAALGVSPLALMESRRLEEAVQFLSETRMSVKEVAERLRFSSPSYFSRVFTRRFDVSPLTFRAKADKRGVAAR